MIVMTLDGDVASLVPRCPVASVESGRSGE
jgi:hypothetical protein